MTHTLYTLLSLTNMRSAFAASAARRIFAGIRVHDPDTPHFAALDGWTLVGGLLPHHAARPETDRRTEWLKNSTLAMATSSMSAMPQFFFWPNPQSFRPRLVVFWELVSSANLPRVALPDRLSYPKKSMAAVLSLVGTTEPRAWTIWSSRSFPEPTP